MWTRHSKKSIVAACDTGVALPVYKEEQKPSQTRYDFQGFYRIVATEEVRGFVVIDFLAARGDSQNVKRAELWEEKANATWLKVTIKRAPVELQQVDPASNTALSPGL